MLTQRKRARLITWKSLDRNEDMLIVTFFCSSFVLPPSIWMAVDVVNKKKSMRWIIQHSPAVDSHNTAKYAPCVYSFYAPFPVGMLNSTAGRPLP